jgi:hypothetical protein
VPPVTCTQTPTVLVVADDLIWASRLVAAADRAGARPRRTGSLAQLEDWLSAAADAAARPAVVVDLAGRSYDPIAAIHAAAGSGCTVLAVGEHGDLELRGRALAAGARRVVAYGRMFADGPAIVGALAAERR